MAVPGSVISGDYTALLTTSLRAYARGGKLADNIFLKTPLLYKLYDGGRKRTEDGGTYIVENLLYDKGTLTTYTGFDTLNTKEIEGITAAEFNWKHFQVPVTISRPDERKNSGKHRIINLLDAKTKQAEKTMRDGLATQLYADGTANSGKNLTGLAAVVATTGTYGNINRATYANQECVA